MTFEEVLDKYEKLNCSYSLLLNFLNKKISATKLWSAEDDELLRKGESSKHFKSLYDSKTQEEIDVR